MCPVRCQRVGLTRAHVFNSPLFPEREGGRLFRVKKEKAGAFRIIFINARYELVPLYACTASERTVRGQRIETGTSACIELPFRPCSSHQQPVSLRCTTKTPSENLWREDWRLPRDRMRPCVEAGKAVCCKSTTLVPAGPLQQDPRERHKSEKDSCARLCSLEHMRHQTQKVQLGALYSSRHM